MGIFNRNFEKEGAGVRKDERKKKGIFLFFELLIRKFLDIIKAGILYFIFGLPVMLVFSYIIYVLSSGIEDNVLRGSLMITGALMLGILWGAGPASAGFAYIGRCYAREEHAWVASDFFERLKQNWKQAVIVAVVDIIVLLAGGISFLTYLRISGQSMLWLILTCVLGVALIVYSFMHIYIYQIMITYECKISALYKTALLCALGKLPLNIILTAVILAVVFLVTDLLGPGLGGLIVAVFLFGIFRFLLEFFAEKTVRKLVKKEE